MNTGLKVIYAILGGCNVIFSLFAPIAIATLWVLKFGSNHTGSSIVLFVAIFATIYKAIDYLSIKEKSY